MAKNPTLPLRVILEAIRKSETYSKDMPLDTFRSAPMRIDAVTFNLSIIDATIPRVPLLIQQSYREIDWSDLQRIIEPFSVSHYFEIDTEHLWKVVTQTLPKFAAPIQKIIDTLSEE